MLYRYLVKGQPPVSPPYNANTTQTNLNIFGLTAAMSQDKRHVTVVGALITSSSGSGYTGSASFSSYDLDTGVVTAGPTFESFTNGNFPAGTLDGGLAYAEDGVCLWLRPTLGVYRFSQQVSAATSPISYGYTSGLAGVTSGQQIITFSKSASTVRAYKNSTPWLTSANSLITNEVCFYAPNRVVVFTSENKPISDFTNTCYYEIYNTQTNALITTGSFPSSEINAVNGASAHSTTRLVLAVSGPSPNYHSYNNYVELADISDSGIQILRREGKRHLFLRNARPYVTRTKPGLATKLGPLMDHCYINHSYAMAAGTEPLVFASNSQDENHTIGLLKVEDDCLIRRAFPAGLPSSTGNFFFSASNGDLVTVNGSTVSSTGYNRASVWRTDMAGL